MSAPSIVTVCMTGNRAGCHTDRRQQTAHMQESRQTVLNRTKPQRPQAKWRHDRRSRPVSNPRARHPGPGLPGTPIIIMATRDGRVAAGQTAGWASWGAGLAGFLGTLGMGTLRAGKHFLGPGAHQIQADAGCCRVAMLFVQRPPSLRPLVQSFSGKLDGESI